MDRYKGRVALVTGASSGIGAAIAQVLVRKGMTVVGIARRLDRIKALKEDGTPGTLHALQADLANEEDILATFKWINENLGGVDVLINNAAVGYDDDLTVSETKDWKHTLDVNVLGLSICTREAVKGMRERGVDDGYIIHISSVAAHIPAMSSGMAMYAATKYAISALTEGLRKDLVASKSNIRNTTISPGLVKTEIMRYSTKWTPDSIYEKNPYMESEDIAECVVFVLSRPLRVQIHDMIVNATGTTMH